MRVPAPDQGCPWPAAPGPGVVIVWRLSLDLPEDAGDALIAGLPATEREALGRCRERTVRRRRLLARVALRRLLGHALGTPTDGIRLVTETGGRPRVDGPTPPGFAFNVSHSRDRALIAIGCAGPLGVDLEVIDPATAIDRLAGRVFSPAELATWREIGPDPDALRQAFFQAWVRKEACAKAHGGGLRLPFPEIRVPLLIGGLAGDGSERDGHQVRPLGDATAGPEHRWALYELAPGVPGFVACLASGPRTRDVRMADISLDGP